MERAQAMVKAALTADALALGVHWIYDPQEVARKFTPETGLSAPGPDSYHKTAHQGDFTHNGDQIMALLRSVAALKTFDLDDFSRQWRQLFLDYPGYHDKATKETLAAYEAGRPPREAGSASSELGGGARLAPLFLVYGGRLETLMSWAAAETSLTHKSPLPMEMAAFFAAAGHHLLGGAGFKAALAEAAKAALVQPQAKELYAAGLGSLAEPTVKALGDFGRSCRADHLFPGLIHILLKYQDDPYQALVQSILAAGDNAVRAILTATLMAAKFGFAFIPERMWLGLNKRAEIETLLSGF